MRRLIRRWIWPVLGVAALALALAYAFAPRPVAVSMAVIAEGPLAVTIVEDGYARVRELYLVSAPLAGRVLRLEGHVGDPVVANQTVVATILPSDPTFLDARRRAELQAALQAAQAVRDLAAAELARQQAELDFAASEYDRVLRLFERGFAAQAALDRSRMELRTREAAVATAQAALQQREYELSVAQAALIPPSPDAAPADDAECCFAVRSPVSGTILRVYQESEGVVAAGAPLAEIGDPTRLEIVADLLSTDAVRVSPGDAVLIERWGGEGVLNAVVRRIEPYGETKISALGIEEQRVDVIIDLTDPYERWQRLGHGYQVDARIVLWRADSVLQVPLGALFRVGEDWAVFRVEDRRAVQRIIALAEMNDQTARVADGLAAGDRVILHPSDQVADGTLVEERTAM